MIKIIILNETNVLYLIQITDCCHSVLGSLFASWIIIITMSLSADQVNGAIVNIDTQTSYTLGTIC